MEKPPIHWRDRMVPLRDEHTAPLRRFSPASPDPQAEAFCAFCLRIGFIPRSDYVRGQRGPLIKLSELRRRERYAQEFKQVRDFWYRTFPRGDL